MLWHPAVHFPLLVVLVCVLFLSVRCCGALRVLLFGAGLVCAVVGASGCGVSLCVVVSPLVFYGLVVVLWCIWSPAVPCCVLWCCFVLWCRGTGLCCVFSFAAGVPFSFKNHFSVFENKNKFKK